MMCAAAQLRIPSGGWQCGRRKSDGEKELAGSRGNNMAEEGINRVRSPPPVLCSYVGAQRWLTELRCELQVVALLGLWVQPRRCRKARIGPLISRSRACYQFL